MTASGGDTVITASAISIPFLSKHLFPLHGKPPRKRSGKKSAPTRAPVIDPLSKVAMDNAYLICHNAEQFLSVRGFPYSGTVCKGGGKKKKGGKKKRK